MAKNAFDVIVARLMEAVHVELSYEAVHLSVSEVSGQDHLLQLADILYHELGARWRPVDDLGELVVLGGGRRTLRISKVLAMKPATSAGYSIEREDIYNANNFKAEQLPYHCFKDNRSYFSRLAGLVNTAQLFLLSRSGRLLPLSRRNLNIMSDSWNCAAIHWFISSWLREE